MSEDVEGIDLSGQEESFCFEWMRTFSHVEAYQSAFDAYHLTKKDAYQKSKILLSRPDIKKRVIELKEEYRQELFIDSVDVIHEIYELSVLAKEEGQFKNSMEMKKLVGQALGLWGTDVKIENNYTRIDEWVKTTAAKRGLTLEPSDSGNILIVEEY